MKPIGILHSPFTEKEQTPIQSTCSNESGWVELFPEFAEGLLGLEEFSHIILLYVFHQSVGYHLKVTPFLDNNTHGLFTTRYPSRPNQIGPSVVHLMARRENILEFKGVDMLDGTPLIDIKPYIPDFDACNDTKMGWYAQRSKE